ncbi:hypothetical protein [Asaia lannensis]|uniref:hypothetical protein n=1 Tax=Asaia lannensis TaxID=415421 RepID=UPI001C99F588
MKSYLAYRTGSQPEPVMIKQGFHWRLWFFGALGFLASRSWICFCLAACASLLILRAAGAYGLPLLVLINLSLACFGAELSGWEARLKGGVVDGIWLGRTAADARLRFFDREVVAS